MHRFIVALSSQILDFLLPRDCLGCGNATWNNSEWCRSCHDAVATNRVVTLGDWRLVAPFVHAGPIRHAVHRLKYSNRSDIAARLVRAGFGPRDPELGPNVVLVPVPLHATRLVERGYNQAALVAKALGQRWQTRVLYDLLLRVANTTPQVGKNREQRAKNLSNAFVVRPIGHKLSPIWLVDDVVTTGSTASSCREALTLAGLSVGGIIAISHATGAEPSPSDPATRADLAQRP